MIGQQERSEHRVLIPPCGDSALSSPSGNVRGFSESKGMVEKGRDAGEPRVISWHHPRIA
ncbi:hypothetical protein PspKH34_34700 [Parageobacillus sp. KH3-4]|nr:hypothetical protein PspKH34_34700 [Parageobacillus sp. KH3-4]